MDGFTKKAISQEIFVDMWHTEGFRGTNVEEAGVQGMLC